MKVGRRYKFRGRHHLPTLPEPWCFVHYHNYTLELVFNVTTLDENGLSVNHEHLDNRVNDWLRNNLQQQFGGRGKQVPYIDLDSLFTHTSVEALARDFRDMFSASECTVTEDDDRWAQVTT